MIKTLIILTSIATSATNASENTSSLPGALPYEPKMASRLQQALIKKGADYEPRTEHLTESGDPVYTNRLILEASPYLLQHAHNPVDWYAWGDEAFAVAAREHKPVFLSIGYSTCHWCHVMERESFENKEIAAYLNRHFVSIKVDREQRPDLDDIYMTAVQLTTGRGGWPMSSFLTTDGKPYFGGTYFPPEQFMHILGRIRQTWAANRQGLIDHAEKVTDAVKQVTSNRSSAEKLGDGIVQRAVTEVVSSFDENAGGFGPAPKFPHEPMLLLLLNDIARTGDSRSYQVLEKTLDEMAAGGIFDQIGGGFHRYATDPDWLVPHFEKMLYNQAHLARIYLEAYRIGSKSEYARVARQTLDFTLREMRSPEGGFYSAFDADSEGGEGEYYIWSKEELAKHLAPEELDRTIKLFGVTDEGNFEGKNILFLPESITQFAIAEKSNLTDVMGFMDGVNEKLMQVRSQRIPPLRDDKIITAWNGMMISALASGFQVLQEPKYLAAAEKSASFIWQNNRDANGALLRLHIEGRSDTVATQKDYAYYAEGLLNLYDASGEPQWLDKAMAITDEMLKRFWDNENGGFFLSSEQTDAPLITRSKSSTDGATPSGNSVAMRVLSMLTKRVDSQKYEDYANRLVTAFAGNIDRNPSGYTYFLKGLSEFKNGLAGELQYAGKGKVRVEAKLENAAGKTKMIAKLAIQDGWHINSSQPLSDNLIATALGVDEDKLALSDVNYPDPERVQLAFQSEPLEVYQGNIEISANINKIGKENDSTSNTKKPVIVPLTLTIQACSDEVCLLPEDVKLELPL